MAWARNGQFPYATALYRLFDADGRFLYVGIAADPFVRLDQHYRAKDWWPLVSYVEIEWFADRSVAADEELRVIREESPLHNVQGRGGYLQRRATPGRQEPISPRERLYWRGDT